jgi:hypothetical protein
MRDAIIGFLSKALRVPEVVLDIHEEFGNGTRIIAFGDAGPPLVVYANYVFADTEANRANVTLGGPPSP